MSKQPEALRLAEQCDSFDGVLRRNGYQSKPIQSAAAELRRLSSVNADLLEALQRLVDMDPAYRRGPAVEDAVEAAIAAIAKATGEA